ncbi:uncharacterized protein DUF1840 [Trinickia symbiotica]|uniref:DUF1840 domain-containing protein n=1 Tax=Trinickia symbiotica TaxID=863227 RepID=A0A2N7X6A3_9BURK|nr:DUF1840 domain-containing protein [Trinickia symbiotica]PMS37005.1 DUF1840 domain-containing protein [Trinickia symbiotica]PPK41536.1 uncharacterized protein DUF1840 [Trinickia symbiotica]
MMVTFKSSAAPDVLMLRDLAQYLLGLVGKRLDARGVILHDELPVAIRRLETAIADEERTERVLEAFQHSHGGQQGPAGNGLSRRAWPFLDMMREAQKQSADIIWGL